MTYVTFGDAHQTRSMSVAFYAQDRFVALLDILGMSRWTEHVAADQIAREVNSEVVDALIQTTTGNINGVSFGPLVGSVTFSDSILLYSPDASWASFVVLCSAVRTLVAVSLSKGIPLRGAISVGPMVADATRSLYVGVPLGDAYAIEKSPTGTVVLEFN
jgi:hypothetical protein